MRLHRCNLPQLEQLEDRLCPSNIAHPSYVIDGTPLISPVGLTPQQLSHAYGFDVTYFTGGIKGDGTGQTIAIVDAYGDPNLQSDLNVFCDQFGLTHVNLNIINQNGSGSLPTPDPTGIWEVEQAADVETVHSLAPGASIIVVQCNSSSFNDLVTGVRLAASLPNVSAVSMSWTTSEFSNETSLDSSFLTPAGHQGVTFVTGSGDTGSNGFGNYPASSPNVLAVGGTTLTYGQDGTYISESGWNGSGGGVSQFEPEPSWQRSVQSSNSRTTPDVSFNAGASVAIYDSFPLSNSPEGWLSVGGTSLGSPAWASIIAIGNQGRALVGLGSLDGTSETIPALYRMSQNYFHDVTNGSNTAFSAGPGYDLVTGRGSPVVNSIVRGLGASVEQVNPPSSPIPSPPVASSSPNTPSVPSNPVTDLFFLAVEQYRALAFHLLAIVDPRDFTAVADQALQQLASNPLSSTLEGRYVEVIVWMNLVQAIQQS